MSIVGSNHMYDTVLIFYFYFWNLNVIEAMCSLKPDKLLRALSGLSYGKAVHLVKLGEFTNLWQHQVKIMRHSDCLHHLF